MFLAPGNLQRRQQPSQPLGLHACLLGLYFDMLATSPLPQHLLSNSMACARPASCSPAACQNWRDTSLQLGQCISTNRSATDLCVTEAWP